ncbi:antitoxin [Rhodococcus sp. HNM0569]|uniref:antitoxin n=1 Tax=Rhodococcus sp. HNM0569 TaxID=2716340 RepID=UPI00146AB7E9|nr:antitoxin [Rhodococcus sp. HNM0569]NLU82492.1 antitoxin [Rhodococcus sp. HNM0569]
MSFADTLKSLIGKGQKAASDNADKIHGAVDKAAGFADDKTGGKYKDQIGKAADAVKKAVPDEEPPAGGSGPGPGPTDTPRQP